MKNDKVVSLHTPAEDVLGELLKSGARQLLTQAVRAELHELLDSYQDLTLEDGRQAVVRNGYLPERTIQTGLGDIPVKVPKVRDRSGQGITFNSKLVPPYLKRAQSIEELLPWLYLKGISTGDFQESLQSLLGADASGLSAGTISRLKKQWEVTMVDGDNEICRTGATFTSGLTVCIAMSGRTTNCVYWLSWVQIARDVKKLLAYWMATESPTPAGKSFFEQLSHQGLNVPPEIAIGDGALGYWKAITKHWPKTKQQRCWVHKTANVLNKLPKSLQAKVKASLHDIWMAETQRDAHKAFDLCLKQYEVKYPKAMECLVKDRDKLLTFYDFPAEHWGHLRTTNPIESVFASVRLRTTKTKNCGSRTTTLAMAFKLMQSAQKRWHRLRGYNLLADVIEGVKFKDGIKVEQDAA